MACTHGRGRSGQLALALAAGAVLALLGGPREVAAKGPSWVLTGGELGDYAMVFYPTTDAEWEIGELRGPRVDAPSEPGDSYDIHLDGWLSPPHYARVAGYYPEADLLYGHTWDDPGDRWMKPDEVTVGMLDRAIAEALEKKAAGELEKGVVAATFRKRGMDTASYTFTRYADAAGAGSLPMMVITKSAGSPEFAMEHLAATLELNRAGTTSDKPEYHITVAGRLGGGTGWGGSLGYYALPRDGQPGRFVPVGWQLSEANTYYETTPGFDAFIRERMNLAIEAQTERIQRTEQAQAFAGIAPARPWPSAALLAAMDSGSGEALRPGLRQASGGGASSAWRVPIALVALGVAGAAGTAYAMRPLWRRKKLRSP